jgi:nuclear pore complex protein Nup155
MIVGVFLEQIEYVLVVATPLEVILLGIAFAESGKKNEPRGVMKLYRTEMSIPSDNVNMTHIVGTQTGRIFMRGNNGQLYELQYQVS